MPAAYLEAYRNGKLEEGIRRGLRWMGRCTLCPRMCKVDRLAGEKGYCRTGRKAVVASYGPHFGEESPLVGRRGSGTIFFSYCNLFCVFCQNYDISHGGEGTPIGAEDLAEIMLSLQEAGCHNINLVTPTHVVCQILEALPAAIERGSKFPLSTTAAAMNGYPPSNCSTALWTSTCPTSSSGIHRLRRNWPTHTTTRNRPGVPEGDAQAGGDLWIDESV